MTEQVPPLKEPPRVEKVVRNEAGQLVSHVTGRDEPVVDARVARCFPWSVPDAYISIRDADGREVVLLETLDDLPEDSRQLVRAELADKVFNPKIEQVLSHTQEFGVISITAETTRGRATFQIRSRDDIHLLSATRAVLRDVDGNKYEVADIEALDAASRKFLDEYF